MQPFEILAPVGPPRAAVAHVPHAATAIPAHVRAGILLDDAGVSRELLRLTDWHVDALCAWLPRHGVPVLVNRVSRLVADPERFADDAIEPMAAVGQGAVYTRTTDGQTLRTPDARARRELLARWFEPYHAALTSLVGERLDHFGACLVIDCHSFASDPLPSEPDRLPGRPDVCIGTDPFHTPPALAAALRGVLAAEGFRVEIDRPFAGALVPLRWYGLDPRVTSVMLEVRRGLYCDEATGEPSAAFGEVRAALERAIGAVVDGIVRRDPEPRVDRP